MTTQIYFATNRPQQRARRLVVGLVSALFAVGLVAACGGDDATDATPVVPDDAAGAVVDTTPEPTDPEPELEVVDVDALLAAWAVYAEDAAETEAQNLQRGFLAEAQAAGADLSQLVILASGPISWADYEAAMNRAIACAQEAGFSVWHQVQQNTAPWPDSIAHNIQTKGGTACDGDRCWRVEPEGIELAAWQCLERYAYFVRHAWTVAVPELVERRRHTEAIQLPLMAQCLQAKGVDVPDVPTRNELNAIHERLTDENPSMQRSYLEDGTFVGWTGNVDPNHPDLYWDCWNETWPQVNAVLDGR